MCDDIRDLIQAYADEYMQFVAITDDNRGRATAPTNERTMTMETTETRFRVDYRAVTPAASGFGMFEAGAETFSYPAYYAAPWHEYWETEDDARFWLESDGEMEPVPDCEMRGKTYNESGWEFWQARDGGGVVLVTFTPVVWDADEQKAVPADE